MNNKPTVHEVYEFTKQNTPELISALKNVVLIRNSVVGMVEKISETEQKELKELIKNDADFMKQSKELESLINQITQ